MVAVFPAQAMFEAKGGRAILTCKAGPDGVLSGCTVESEDPVGYGFGDAALKLSKSLRAGPCPQADPAGETVRAPLRFVPPPAPPWREAAFDPQASTYAAGRLWPAGPYWPDAALRAGIGGTAVLDCQADAAGKLSACRAVAVTPNGEAFADASLLMAKKGWLMATPLGSGESPAADMIYRLKVVFPPRTLRDAR